MVVLIELCRIEMKLFELVRKRFEVLIELCRIEILKTYW